MPRKNYPAKKQTKPKASQPKRFAGRKKNQDQYSDIQNVEDFYEGTDDSGAAYCTPKEKKLQPLRAMTEAQGLYAASIIQNDITFGVGCAGTGKTFVALSLACEALERKETDKIIVSRPLIATGEKLGALPGDLGEKISPYFDAALRVFNKVLGRSYTKYLMDEKRKKIEFVPLELMTGYTFDDCWVVLDECENATRSQVKRFLTRIGIGTKAIVNGDSDQADIRDSGLEDAVYRFKGFEGVGIVRFEEDDVVRSGIVKTVLRAYRN